MKITISNNRLKGRGKGRQGRKEEGGGGRQGREREGDGGGRQRRKEVTPENSSRGTARGRPQ